MTNKTNAFVILAVLATASILLSGTIFTPAVVNAVQFSNNFATETVVVTDDNGKTFVATISSEEGFDQNAIDAIVVGDDNDNNGGNVTEVVSTANETDSGIPDVVVVPIPEGNDTSIVVVNENDTAVLAVENQTTDNPTGDVSIVTVDNDNATVTNTTDVTTDDDVVITIGGDNTTSTSTGNETSTIVGGGSGDDNQTSTVETGVNETSSTETESPIQCVVAPCEVTGDNGTSTSTSTGNETGDNTTSSTDIPVVVDETPDTNGDNVTSGGGNGTETSEEGEVTQECPIHGQIFNPDGSVRNFQLCYSS